MNTDPINLAIKMGYELISIQYLPMGESKFFLRTPDKQEIIEVRLSNKSSISSLEADLVNLVKQVCRPKVINYEEFDGN